MVKKENTQVPSNNTIAQMPIASDTRSAAAISRVASTFSASALCLAKSAI